jgi:hypothetical protein
MASDTKKDILKAVRQRRYLNKEFDSFKADLLEYAKTYYANNINDFSDSSLGGLLLDLPAYVGDVMSFYLDHSFSELDPDTAVETANIEKLLLGAGVDIVGASPAIVRETFFVEVPAATVNNVAVPDPSAIPIIDDGTIISADNGTEFLLIEPVDFTLKKPDGTFACDVLLGDTTSDGTPTSFVLRQSGVCVSGFRTQETFSIGTFSPFRTVTLANPNVTQIDTVYDSLGNVYYEVESLADDVVFTGMPNLNDDGELVKEALALVPAPYRYTKQVNLDSRTTTLTFGGGSADTLEDDVVPDPSTFAIPLYGKQTFTRLAINPLQLLNTKTLGVIASNVTLFVGYRFGGGLGHNADPETVQTIKTLGMTFPGNPTSNVASRIRSTTQATNKAIATGGDDPPTFDDLKAQIPATRNSQKRIVTKADLLARVYTMPSNFGRVFRAAVRSNPNNPLAAQLFIISRDANSRLVVSPDTLKQNLATYLNQYRMISDAIDILDVQVVNLKLNFEVITDPTQNKKLILQTVIQKLKKYLDIKNFQVDQPINLQDISNIIFNTLGVVSINNVRFDNVISVVNNRVYNDVYFDVQTNTTKGLIIPPPGGIFEVRFPDVDLVGKAS